MIGENIGLSLALYGFVFGVLSALFPKGKSEKSLKLLISVILLSLTVTATFGLLRSCSENKISVDTDTPSSLSFEDNITYYQEAIEEKLTAQLASERLSVKQILVFADISEDGRIDIIEIRFCPEDRANRDLIQKRIVSLCGCENVREVTS